VRREEGKRFRELDLFFPQAVTASFKRNIRFIDFLYNLYTLRIHLPWVQSALRSVRDRGVLRRSDEGGELDFPSCTPFLQLSYLFFFDLSEAKLIDLLLISPPRCENLQSSFKSDIIRLHSLRTRSRPPFSPPSFEPQLRPPAFPLLLLRRYPPTPAPPR